MTTNFAKLTGIECDSMADRGAFDCIEGKKVELIRGQLRFLNRESPIHDDYIDYLSESDGKSYRKIELAVAPRFLAPTCLPTAKLDLTDLFSVK